MNTNKLKEILHAKKISYELLAKRVGMTRNGLSEAINKNTLKVQTLEKIASELNVPVCEFYTNEAGGDMFNNSFNNNSINSKNSANELTAKIKLLEMENEGLKRELKAKDQIIKLLQTISEKK